MQIEAERVQAVLALPAPLEDAADREIAGFHRALTLIHSRRSVLSISDQTIRQLHQLLFPDAADSGVYDQASRNLGEGGTATSVFDCIAALIRCWNDILAQRSVHPIIAAIGFDLDFRRLQPFSSGNDRVAVVLFSLLCRHVGFDVNQYVCLERLIDRAREPFQQAFRASSRNWEQGAHDPWPYVDFLLSILNEGYKEIQMSLAGARMRKGAKTESVLEAIRQQTHEFKLVDIQRLCPSVGRDLIRTILAELRNSGELTCEGRGPAARWRRSAQSVQ
jgi:Fic family protein